MIFLFKSFSRAEYAKYIIEVLGNPKGYITEEMDYATNYISEGFKTSYLGENIKNLKGKKVLFLCAEYKEREDNNFKDYFKFIPIRYCIISSISSSNGNLWFRLKLDNFVDLGKNLSIHDFTSNIRKEIGEENLPCWYKCGINRDQTKFKVATIGNANYIKEKDPENKLEFWQNLTKEIINIVENAKYYVFYFIDGLYVFNLEDNLLIYKDSKSKQNFKLNPNSRYTLKLWTYAINQKYWINQEPYLKFAESQYLIASDIKDIRIDSIRATPLILSFSTKDKQIKKKVGAQIFLEFGPTNSFLSALKIKFPFYIFKRSSIILFIIFLIFLSVKIIGDSVLSFTEVLTIDQRILWYTFSTLGNIMYLLLLYRKRI